ncbi:MAG: tetratricopeptide repeat protein, partial [candidate division KSB1 bacterium]|nr:tetratricopeptide repeat protein [candidate division KSB1 bacterium]
MKVTRIFCLALWTLILGPGELRSQSSGENMDFLYAQRLFDDGMYELAAAQFRQFVENYPTSFRASDALFLAGESFFKIQKYDQARQAFLELTVRYPQAPKIDQAQFKIGDCYRELKNYEEAAKAYQRVKVFYPASPLAATALVEAGRMFVVAQDYTSAINTFYSFIEEFPQDPQYLQVRLELVDVLTRKGELNRALSEIDKLLSRAQRTPVGLEASYQKGMVLEQMGRIKEAQDEYLSLIPLCKDTNLLARTYFRLGLIYRIKSEWNQSSEYFIKSLQSQGPESLRLETYLKLGDNQFDLKNFSRAQENYKKVIEMAPQNNPYYIEGLYKLGLVYEHLADYKNAIASFQRIVTATASEYLEQAYLRLAQNYLQLRDANNAINYFNTYLEKFDSSPIIDRINYQIGQIYEVDLKDPRRALRAYERFVEHFPRSPLVDEAQLGIARCYEALRDYESAFREYQLFLGTYPGGSDYDLAERRSQFLQKYLLKNTTQALGKLSALFGDLITKKDQAQLLHKLALVYFEDLKDYHQAVKYFRACLALDDKNVNPDEVLYRLGQSYQALAQLEDSGQARADSARLSFKLLVETYPQSPWADDAAIELAEMEIARESDAQQRSFKMADQFSSLLLKFPESPRKDYMLLRLGDAFSETRPGLTSDSLQSASSYYQRLLTHYPGSSYRAQTLFKLGLDLLRAGETLRAQKQLEEYIEKFPEDKHIVKAHYLLAELLRKKQDYQKGVQLYQKILTVYFYSPYADSATVKLGDVLMEKGDYRAAINHYLSLEQKANRIAWLGTQTPTYSRQVFSKGELEYRLGQAYEKVGELSQAKAKYQQYLREVPDGVHAPEILFALGRITAAEGQSDQQLALSYFQRLKEEYPDKNVSFDAALSAADLLFNKGDYQKARTEYLRAANLTDVLERKEYAQAQAIVCLYRSGNVSLGDTEVEAFKKQFGKTETYLAQFEYEKGEYYLKDKSFEAAEKIFKKVKDDFKRTPYASQAELALGKLYLITNKDEQALKVLTELPTKYPDSDLVPVAYLNLGDFYFRQKQVENAMLLYKKALEHPKAEKVRPTAMRMLIQCYDLTRMWDRALSLTRDYLNEFPQAEDA